jgi:VWFA-related protein
MPSIAFAQDDVWGSKNKEIIIKDIENKDYPDIDVYINFTEDSNLGSIDLSEDDFSLEENGIPINDFVLSKIGHTLETVGIVLLIDTSGSMQGKPIEDALNSCSLFIQEMGDNDLVSIIGFSSDVSVYSDFSSNKDELESHISGIKTTGNTSLYDAVIAGASQFENLKDVRHRYIILLTDGKDTTSQATLEDAISKSLEQDVTIYSIALLSKDFDPSDIEKMSQDTGGQMLSTFDSGDLIDLYTVISQKIRNQYVLSFASKSIDIDEVPLRVSVIKAGYEDSVDASYSNPLYQPPEETRAGPGYHPAGTRERNRCHFLYRYFMGKIGDICTCVRKRDGLHICDIGSAWSRANRNLKLKQTTT